MRYLKKIRRHFLIFTLSIFTLLTIGYFIPSRWCNSVRENCHLTICVSNTGIHTNIVTPVKNAVFDWQNYLKIDDIGNSSLPNYNYLSFGWGDREFYMNTPSLADINLVTTFNALFLPTPSVMEIQGYSAIPHNIGIKCVKISEQDYSNLMQFIKNSFQIDTNGKTIRIRQGHSSYSSFYEAKGNYSILRNCNSWTAEGLRKANVNTPLWAGLSSAIIFHVKNSCRCRE
ncbi:MAG TPA: TIGR02117 family protein [Leptolyngbyaceae cyanobacterium]